MEIRPGWRPWLRGCAVGNDKPGYAQHQPQSSTSHNIWQALHLHKLTTHHHIMMISRYLMWILNSDPLSDPDFGFQILIFDPVTHPWFLRLILSCQRLFFFNLLCHFVAKMSSKCSDGSVAGRCRIYHYLPPCLKMINFIIWILNPKFVSWRHLTSNTHNKEIMSICKDGRKKKIGR